VCDFHCLIVLKKEIHLNTWNPHINDIGTNKLPEEVFSELWILLNKTSFTIKKCSANIKTVSIASLNSGMDSKHTHFHLIPILKNDNVKKVNSLDIDGGGFSFLARKEIVDDTLSDFIGATCWDSSSKILDSIDSAQKKRVSENVKLLRKFFAN
jgi:diadenosine tetraphosphate (Ap4A) HIT family hydrolase